MSPVKEPKYFTLTGQNLEFQGPGDERIIKDTPTSPGNYLALFQGVRNERAIGEASTIYMNDDRASQRIAEQIPNARLIAVLRHPADHAYSAYMHLRRDGWEPLESFSEALDAETARHNQSGIPRNRALQDCLRKSHPFKEQMKRFIPERFGHRLISMI